MTSELASDATVPSSSVSLGAALAMSAPTVLVSAVEAEPKKAGSEPSEQDIRRTSAAVAAARIAASRAAGTDQKTMVVPVVPAAAAEDGAESSANGGEKSVTPAVSEVSEVLAEPASVTAPEPAGAAAEPGTGKPSAADAPAAGAPAAENHAARAEERATTGAAVPPSAPTVPQALVSPLAPPATERTSEPGAVAPSAPTVSQPTVLPLPDEPAAGSEPAAGQEATEPPGAPDESSADPTPAVPDASQAVETPQPLEKPGPAVTDAGKPAAAKARRSLEDLFGAPAARAAATEAAGAGATAAKPAAKPDSAEASNSMTSGADQIAALRAAMLARKAAINARLTKPAAPEPTTPDASTPEPSTPEPSTPEPSTPEPSAPESSTDEVSPTEPLPAAGQSSDETQVVEAQPTAAPGGAKTAAPPPRSGRAAVPTAKASVPTASASVPAAKATGSAKPAGRAYVSGAFAVPTSRPETRPTSNNADDAGPGEDASDATVAVPQVKETGMTYRAKASVPPAAAAPARDPDATEQTPLIDLGGESTDGDLPGPWTPGRSTTISGAAKVPAGLVWPGSDGNQPAGSQQASSQQASEAAEAAGGNAGPTAPAGWTIAGSRLEYTAPEAVEYRPIPETAAMQGPSKEAVARLNLPGRPPIPVLLAAGLLGLLTAGFLVLAMFMATLGPAILLAPLVGATLTGFLAFGLWRGARGANLVTLLISVICVYTGISNLITGSGGGAITAIPRIVLGAAFLGLLLGDRTTRRHFWS